MTVIRHPNNQGVTLSQWRKTAAGGETSVSGTDDFSAGLAYTAGAEQVFVNGVLLERGVDYTASTGTTVTGLTALVAGDIVTVSSPSAFNVANAIPKATITAKGDLLVGTGASTPANLAVGADGTTLVANSASATGVAWAGPTFTAGKNKIINGDFGIWQRGTSFSLTASTGAYTADRFFCITDGSGGSVTVSQQTFTVGQTAVPNNPTYFLRNTVTTAPTSVSYFDVRQYIENVNTFAGQTISISFYAQSSGTPSISIIAGQNFGSGGSSAVYTSGTLSSSALTSSWVKYTGTINLPSISGKTVGSGNALQIFIRVANPTTGLTWDMSNLQIEAGSVATPFTTATGTLSGELQACQRYYYRTTQNANLILSTYGIGNSTTVAYCPIPLPVIMRVTPTALDYSSIYISDSVNGFTGIASVTVSTSSNAMGEAAVTINSGTLIQFRGYKMEALTNGGYVGFSAEL